MNDKPSDKLDDLKDHPWRWARPLDEPNSTWFPEIKGLCRTCKHAFLFQREHGERPEIVCQAIYERPRRMPPDVMKCSDFKKRGELSLEGMADMALLLDPRESGGQYL